MKYRIVRVKEYNDIYYIIQEKFLFFWWMTICKEFTDAPVICNTLAEAEDIVEKLRNKPKKTVIKVYD